MLDTNSPYYWDYSSAYLGQLVPIFWTKVGTSVNKTHIKNTSATIGATSGVGIGVGFGVTFLRLTH